MRTSAPILGPRSTQGLPRRGATGQLKICSSGSKSSSRLDAGVDQGILQGIYPKTVTGANSRARALASAAACCERASCDTAESITQYFKSPKCLLAELAFRTTETSVASSARLCESRANSRTEATKRRRESRAAGSKGRLAVRGSTGFATGGPDRRRSSGAWRVSPSTLGRHHHILGQSVKGCPFPGESCDEIVGQCVVWSVAIRCDRH